MSILFHLYTHSPSHTCKERLFSVARTHTHPLSGLPSVLTSQAVLAPLRPGTQSMAVPLLSVSLGLTNTLMHKASPTLTFISHRKLETSHEAADSRLNVRLEKSKSAFSISLQRKDACFFSSNFACSLHVTTELTFLPVPVPHCSHNPRHDKRCSRTVLYSLLSSRSCFVFCF